MDDVLGGSAAWENVDSTEGISTLVLCLIFHQSPVRNVSMIELILCSCKFDQLMSQCLYFTSVANAFNYGESDK